MIPERREIQITEPRPISQEVFQSYITANLLWPQTNVGLTILPLAAYFQEMDSIDGFFETELSINQQQEIASIMNNAHKAVDVDVTSDGNRIDMGKSTEYDPIQSIAALWRQVKVFDLSAVATYIDYAKTGRINNTAFLDIKSPNDIYTFFKNADNKIHDDVMKRSFSIAKDTLLSRDGLALARLHRWDITRGKEYSSHDEEMTELWQDYDESLGNEYRYIYDRDNDFEVSPEEMGCFLIEEQLAANIPEINTGWLFS